jgi:hypothetical protein
MSMRFLQILFVSALTGVAVGAAVSGGATIVSGGDLGQAAAIGAVAGALIGLAAAAAFLGLSLNARRRPLLSFLSVGPIVGVGAALANRAAGVSSRALDLAIVAASLVLAYATTFLWYRSYRRWNARLQEYQRSNQG